MRMTWRAVALAEDELHRICCAEPPFAALERIPRRRWTGLEEDWHAAHWLITGEAGPVEGLRGFIQSGGREVAQLEATHGPARFFEPEAVAGIRELLFGLSREELVTRWSAKTLEEAGIYPFSQGLEEEDLWFVLDHLEALREFLGGLEAHSGLLVFLD